MDKLRRWFCFILTVFLCLILFISKGWTEKISEGGVNAGGSDTLISLDLKDAEISNVLKILGEKSGLNIIADSSVRGRMTLFLKDVPLWEAIELVLKSNNYAYQRVNFNLLISSADKLPRFVVTEIIPLKYASPGDIKDTVKSFLSPGGNLQVDLERNLLIITDTLPAIDKIKNILKDLDSPVAQVMLEAKIIEVSSEVIEKYGIKWNESISASYSASFGTTVSGQANLSSIVATLNLLEQKGKAKTLANPRIATLNNKEARILIGDRVPYTVTTYSAQGVAQITVNFIETGIKLNITPCITEGKFITTRIKPEISSYTWKGDIPQVKTREVESIIRVKDGETIILGGLKNSEERETIFKVPILGWIPILDWLFTYKYKEVVESEIIVMITPHILPVVTEKDSGTKE